MVMLPGMGLRQLRYFVAVAEAGNISRAAQNIFLTQPALSRQVKALEDEIGQCLLEQQMHSIRLRPAREVLLREGRKLLAHADQVPERTRAADCVCASPMRPRWAPGFCRLRWESSPKHTPTPAWNCLISRRKRCRPGWQPKRWMSS